MNTRRVNATSNCFIRFGGFPEVGKLLATWLLFALLVGGYSGAHAVSEETEGGSINVRLFNVIDNTSLPNQRLDLYRYDGEKKYWSGRAYTDENGNAGFTGLNFEGGASYYLRARPYQGISAYSPSFFNDGEINFPVGGMPVTVKNPISGNVLANKRVYLYERRDDGSNRYAGAGYTDSSGIIQFSPPGLGAGRNYLVRTKPYNTGNAYSDVVTTIGAFEFLVGTVPVTVVDASTESALPGVRVYLYERLENGKSKHRANGYTDNEGTAHFTPSGLEDGKTYYVKTRPFGSNYAYSKDITRVGAFQFEVGTLPLTLVNPISGEIPVGVKVYLYERMADGSNKYRGRDYTNSQGLVKFTPFGLGEGSTFFAKARPYNGGNAYSQDITEKGAAEFQVGTLPITLVDPILGTTLVGQKIHLYERLEEGKTRWRAYGYTNDAGQVHFTPSDLGNGATFFARARPYNSDYAYTDDITTIGAQTFEVGTLPIQVSNPIDGINLSGLKVYLYETLDDGSTKYRGRGYTDPDGLVRFSPSGLGNGRNYFAKARPYSAGYAYTDPITAPGPFEFHVGTLPITVKNPLDGTLFSGLRVYIYERLEGDSVKYRGSGYTDSNGQVKFTPSGLGDGRTYFVKAKPYNTGYAYSSDIASVGAFDFEVGTLRMRVADFNSNDVFEGLRVYFYERVNGESQWRGYGYTDSQGFIYFTPSGMDDGRTYYAKTKAFGNGYDYSDDITANGDFDFKLGTLTLNVISNIDASPLAEAKVYLYQQLAEGERRYWARGYTDANGVLRYTPSGLGNGTDYLARAKSPVNGRYRNSQTFDQKGSFTFKVGNDPLIVKLVNGVSGDGVPERKVYAKEILEDGTKKYRDRGYTDENGQLMFDIDGLGDGINIGLATKPYNTGYVYSALISQPGEFRFPVGTSPVTLVDGDTAEPIAGKKIHAYRKLPSAELQWVKYGYGDETGTVHFDLDFSDGNPFVFYTKNVFGENKRYYSPLVDSPGPVPFIITLNGDNTLDLTPPEVSITTPVDGGNVTENGFTIQGLATDNRGVDTVVVMLTNGSSTTTINAVYEVLTSSWSAIIDSSLISAGDNLAMTVTVTDRARNSSKAGVSVSVVADNEGPVVTVTSHANNDSVPETGFLVSGTAVDLTGVASMDAVITDANDAGFGPLNRSLNVASNGDWTLIVSNTDVSQGQLIQVDLTATDTNGNVGNGAITLNVVVVDTAGQQLINRITFGATPALLSEVETIGPDAFINQQLDPTSIDDSQLQTMLGAALPTTTAELQVWTLMHMIHSRRQLLEVMTWFWDNHFNTDIRTMRMDANGNNVSNSVAFELEENLDFRANALGRFTDLLLASAQSQSMLIYLDSISNVVGDSNENYSREVMELSALGVEDLSTPIPDDSAYTEADVAAAAELFTGWHIQNDDFFFDASQHNETAQTVMGQVFDGVGVLKGEAFLDMLARHPSTAYHICTKLTQLFVNDAPPQAMVDRCAATFLATGDAPDQMAQVLRTLLSNEFFDAANYRAKIKSPVELVTSVMRNMDATTDATDLPGRMAAMGLRLYENPVPTGYSETGDDWINSSLLIERLKWVNDVVRNVPGGSGSSMNAIPYFFDPANGRNFATNDAIVGFLLQNTTGSIDGGDASGLIIQQLLSVFGAYQMDLSNPANAAFDDAVLRQLSGTTMSLPQFQFQ